MVHFARERQIHTSCFFICQIIVSTESSVSLNAAQKLLGCFCLMWFHPDTSYNSDFLKACQVLVSDYDFVMPVTFVFIYHWNVKFYVFYCLAFLCTIMLTEVASFLACPMAMPVKEVLFQALICYLWTLTFLLSKFYFSPLCGVSF